jgi:hypothetical protein
VARILGMALLGALVAGGAGPVPGSAQPAPLTPTEIYVKMRAAVNALPVPAYIAFTEQDSSTHKYALLQDRLRIVMRTSDAHAWMRTIVTAIGNPGREEPLVVTNGVYPGTPIERVGEFPLADFGLRPRRAFRYLITVDTAMIGGHLVNAGAYGHFEVHRGLIYNYAGDGRWAISEVTFPADPPAWLFDPDHYKDQKGEAVPDL